MKVLLKLFLLVLLTYGCSSSQKNIKATYTLDTIEIRPENNDYRGSATRLNDLLHTKLEVSFDAKKQYLIAKANLTFKPYFYSTSELVLDAKGFEISKLGIVENGVFTKLNYTYDTLQIFIELPREYSRIDTFEIEIEYVAKPNELTEGGSKAITSAKGLYFINPEGKEPNKPFQIWTQGETEASSCWFPTIDKPNERTTQEMYITVADTLLTLSNGTLVSSVKNTDSTRTDYWKQDLPHAPYLFMMTIGQFSVIEDSWRDVPVNYYVEPYYEIYANDIFGNTPEMIEYYSTVLGVPYPWAKYAQVAVRDYVSGAMENTSASIFLEGVQKTKREMIDGDYEGIVAHELFHQWFGDLVTCESWSNIPLNEAFATYGEYLWKDYKNGNDEASKLLTSWQNQYFREALTTQNSLIRFYYNDQEDMFDRHSYQKGGAILHMLRNYLGDEAFFEGLKIYLTENAYHSVEVHQLRLAFEEACGEDLNWFFNQWFLSPGHPELVISYEFDEGLLKLTVEQEQKEEQTPLYQLPVNIDFYFDNNIVSESITIKRRKQTFEFPFDQHPDLINFDADKMLLCKKREINKTTAEYVFQYENALLYADKLEAINYLAEVQEKETTAQTIIKKALTDTFWEFRMIAVEALLVEEHDELKELVAKMAVNDKKSQVRKAAINRLSELEDEQYLTVFTNAFNDSSFMVAGAALKAAFALDEEVTYKAAQQFDEYDNYHIVTALGKIYAEYGGEDKQQYFDQKIVTAKSYARYSLIKSYGEYLIEKNGDVVRKGIATLQTVAKSNQAWWYKLAATSSIHNLKENITEHLERSSKKSKKNEAEEAVNSLEDLRTLNEELTIALEEIIGNETDEKLLEKYEKFN